MSATAEPRDVLAAVDPSEILSLTRELIAIPSPLWGESVLARWIADWMAARGYAVELQPVPLPGG